MVIESPSERQHHLSSVVFMHLKYQDCRKQNGSSIIQKRALLRLLQTIFAADGEALMCFSQMSIEFFACSLILQQSLSTLPPRNTNSSMSLLITCFFPDGTVLHPANLVFNEGLSNSTLATPVQKHVGIS